MSLLHVEGQCIKPVYLFTFVTDPSRSYAGDRLAYESEGLLGSPSGLLSAGTEESRVEDNAIDGQTSSARFYVGTVDVPEELAE